MRVLAAIDNAFARFEAFVLSVGIMHALGTPAHALVVASSESHGQSFVVVPEELLTHLLTLSGEPGERLIRADMTYFETPNGGAVFSVGSITFCGSLSHNGYQNDISRILDNVVRRFRD